MKSKAGDLGERIAIEIDSYKVGAGIGGSKSSAGGVIDFCK